MQPYMMAYFWIALAVVLVLVEVASVQLVSVWFVLGAVCAAVTSIFTDSLVIQIVVFVSVSLAALVITRPLVKKFKTNRKKLTGAYSDKEKLAAICYVPDDESDIVILSTSGRALVVRSGELLAKTTRTTQGVAVMKQKRGHRVISARLLTDGVLSDPERYRAKSLPSMGQFPRSKEGEQMSFSDT